MRGATLRWADVQILAAPSWITVLRGRLGPDDAVARSPSALHYRFSLVAKGTGRAEAELRVRAVVCEGDTCRTVQQLVQAALAVGPAPR